MDETPRIISVDDHVVEPPDLFERWLPKPFRDDPRAPRVKRVGIASMTHVSGQTYDIVYDDSQPKSDAWFYEDLVQPHKRHVAAVGFARDDMTLSPITYDEMRPGCYDPRARLDDMDLNHVEASLCFPTFPRFCGQVFAERSDKELALACVRAYNDWMVEEWAGDSGGRLVPLCIVPLWDAQLAADEVLRNAARGVRAVAFSELPGKLDLPTIHSGEWEPFFAACNDTATAVFMHIGSGSMWLTSSPDAPPAVTATLVFLTSVMALTDWLLSGVLARHPDLRICFAEGQVGWIPYVLERADNLWAKDVWALRKQLPEPPSRSMRQVYGAFFDDRAGLAARDVIGIDQLTFEPDYPHQDSTWPHTIETVETFADMLDDVELRKVLHDNAATLLGLDRA